MTPYLAALVAVAVAVFVARIDLIARLGTTMTPRRLLGRYLAVHVTLVAAGVPLTVMHVLENGHPWWRAAIGGAATYLLAGALVAADYTRMRSATAATAMDRDDVAVLGTLVVFPIPCMLLALRRLPAGGARWVVRS